MNGIVRATLAFLLVAGALASPGMTAPQAQATEGDPIYGASMYFPVVGDNYYSDTFGAPRSGGRTHHGVDIMADKMVPVVAVADGTVGWIHNEQGGDCCAMALKHDDGWESWYIHLNNDTPGTDDGLGYGFAPGIEAGVHVFAGQLIGWVGDSGNAEWTGSHLHFEVHEPGGVVVNPTPHVDAAIILDAPLPDPDTPPADPEDPPADPEDPPVEPEDPPVEPEDPVVSYEGQFSDDEFSVHQADIEKLFVSGITAGCNPPLNDQYCPQREITRGEMTAFLRRNLELPDAETDYFVDDAESEFEADINALAAAGIAFGCTEGDYCPNAPLLRDELAEFLVLAYKYKDPNEVDFFVDDDGNRFEASINALASHGITLGCNPPENDQYCPDRSLTRAEMASFFVRALDL